MGQEPCFFDNEFRHRDEVIGCRREAAVAEQRDGPPAVVPVHQQGLGAVDVGCRETCVPFLSEG